MVKLLDDISYSSIPTASLGEITAINCYSEYHNGDVLYGSTATLRQFVKPRMQQDLTIGYDGWVAQHAQRPPETNPFGKKSLDFLIEACLCSENPDALLQAKVVTKRGILFRLSQDKKDCCLNVSFIDGRLFIEEHDKNPEESKLTPVMHIGHAFKEACTSGSQYGDWSTVVSRSIGDINVLFGAQVDCVKDRNKDYRLPENLVQLKTMLNKYRVNESRPQSVNWHTYGGWYLQSLFIDIHTIFVGYRNRKNKQELLVETDNIPIESLLPPPEYSNLFDPGRSLGRVHRVLNALLDFTSTQQKKEDRVKVWRAHILREGGLEIEEVSRTGDRDLDGRVGIIKSEAVEEIRQLELLSNIEALTI